MPYIGRKLSEDDEPLGGMVYEWSDYAMQKIRAALAAGGPPPTFNQQSPWHWIWLSSTIERDQELHGRVFVDIHERRVFWERPADDDDELA